MIEVDIKEFQRLEKELRRYETTFRAPGAKILRDATRPMVIKAKAEAPTGKSISRNGWGKKTGPEFARGGMTKRDIRFTSVPPVINGEISRVLIGVSKRKGRVGWRTHFITKGFTDRGGKKHGPNDFLQRAYDSTIEYAKQYTSREISQALVRWAKRNLPQGRF